MEGGVVVEAWWRRQGLACVMKTAAIVRLRPTTILLKPSRRLACRPSHHHYHYYYYYYHYHITPPPPKLGRAGVGV
ncbi:hypothetical protein E2C01_084353 [Portunus trituberculatus]|uniref:Uncharacterized protein n=1 Tax=Portunus trituberculatus TaxID=210409 RepID=A0A5B7J790_PORTR|nr:hypothetical protein [Portunus trituberculatus]